MQILLTFNALLVIAYFPPDFSLLRNNEVKSILIQLSHEAISLKINKQQPIYLYSNDKTNHLSFKHK